MNVQEIINMIKLKYQPAESYTDSQIITLLNDIHVRIFRTMYKPETATTYDILADNPFYPIGFSPELIIDVVVNGSEYPHQNIKYNAYDRYYYITDDNCIGLYPTPTEDIDGGLTAFHYKEPSTISSVGDTPELDQAWHLLLVYGACKEIAINRRDDLSELFSSEYNNLERQYYKSKRAVPHRIMDVYGVGRGAM